MPKSFACIWLIMLVSMTGCASKPPADAAASGSVALSAHNARALLPNAENGLELRRWTMIGDPAKLRAALGQMVDGQALDQEKQARLRANGFRFVRVPEQSLDQLLTLCGGALVDSTEWHGQVHVWRSLASRTIVPATDATAASEPGRAVAIDGRIRRYDRGEFRLVARSWTVQMEDGPRLQLELLTQHHRPVTNDLRRLLGEKQQPIEGFASAAIDLRLEPGYAYVLVGDSPDSSWPAELSGPPASTAPPRLAHQPRVGPGDAYGPEAVAPLTLGEYLLAGPRKPPTRDVLVFVPRIGPELMPQQPTGAMAATPRGSGGQ